MSLHDIVQSPRHSGEMLGIALDWIQQDRQVALATVIAAWGSSPLPVGTQMVIDQQGAFQGSVSGGCIEGAVITEAMEVIQNGHPKRLFFGVSNEQAWDVGLACGGEIEIFVEKPDHNLAVFQQLMTDRQNQHPVCLVTNLTDNGKLLIRTEDDTTLAGLPSDLQAAVVETMDKEINRIVQSDQDTYFIHAYKPQPQMIIIGAVHIAIPLVQMAELTGFEPVVIDPRAAFASRQRFPDVNLRCEWPDEALETIPLHIRTAMIALTHDPKIDDPALLAALGSPAFYIGALGSRKTHADRLQRLGEQVMDKQTLTRIHGPVGLDIKALTPAEIAVSIMAEIVQSFRAQS